MMRGAPRMFRLAIEAIIFVAIATLFFIIALQQDAPTKFIYYNF